VKGGLNIPEWGWYRLHDESNVGGTFYFSSLADYAEQRPYAFIQQRGNGHIEFVEKVVGVFIQDEIRMRPNLSLSIGLRYSWQNYFEDTNNLAPRAAFAFAPAKMPGTVIRGGAGLFYDQTGSRPIQDLLRYDGSHLQHYVITDPSYPDPLQDAQTLAAIAPSLVRLAPDINIASRLQYSVGIERQLRKSTSLSLTFTGSRGFGMFRSRDINAPTPPLFEVRPDPRLGVVRQIESAGRFASHSLQIGFRGRAMRFFDGSIQYTLSEAHNDTSGIAWMPPNAYDLSGEYARADFDRRHRLDVIGTVKAGSLFTLGVALAVYSARPYSITTGHDDFNDGVANARPPGVPRNSLDGPSYANLDLRWSRDLWRRRTSSSEGSSLAVAVDVFNVLNRINYTSYVGTLTSPFFGRAITAEPPRRTQLSLRFRF
jgi:outer membrane receptor protein involved in Fe transport